MSALTILKKQFPQVSKVQDSKRTITVNVTPKDTKSGRKKDPNNCALAKACVRSKIADIAIIGISFSYLIKGNKATRYKTLVGVGREITSFDRHQDFAEGLDYKLSKVSPSSRLNKEYKRKSGLHTGTKINSNKIHHTDNIRIIKHHK